MIDVFMYWGVLFFISGFIYFGVIMVLFFIMGLFLVDGLVKWWFGLGILLILLLLMGKNFEGFNCFFFDVFFLYNKFWMFNFVFSVMVLLVLVLVILCLYDIFLGKKDKE